MSLRILNIGGPYLTAALKRLGHHVLTVHPGSHADLPTSHPYVVRQLLSSTRGLRRSNMPILVVFAYLFLFVFIKALWFVWVDVVKSHVSLYARSIHVTHQADGSHCAVFHPEQIDFVGRSVNGRHFTGIDVEPF